MKYRLIMVSYVAFLISAFCMSVDTVFPAARAVGSVAERTFTDWILPAEDTQGDTGDIKELVSRVPTGEASSSALSGALVNADETKTIVPKKATFLLSGEEHEWFEQFGGCAGFCAKIERRRKRFDACHHTNTERPKPFDEDRDYPDGNFEDKRELQESAAGYDDAQKAKKVALRNGLITAIKKSDKQEFMRLWALITWDITEDQTTHYFADLAIDEKDKPEVCAYYSSYSLLQIAVITWCTMLDQSTQVSGHALGAARDIICILLFKDFDYNETFEIIGLKYFDDYREMRLIDLVIKYGLLADVVQLLPTACERGKEELVTFLLPMVPMLSWGPGKKEQLYSECVGSAARNKHNRILKRLFARPEICTYDCLRQVFTDAVNADNTDEKYMDEPLGVFVHTVLRYFVRYNPSVSGVFQNLLRDLVGEYCKPKKDRSKESRLLEVIKEVLQCAQAANCLSAVILQQIFLIAKAQAGMPVSHHPRIIFDLFKQYSVID